MIIDLNCDMGESEDGQSLARDKQIMPWISSCNIACGFHSGSTDVIRKTIDLAVAQNVAVGAHPSYRDREGFGRRPVKLTSQELIDIVSEQITLLQSLTKRAGTTLHHVKPHGALYNHLANHAIDAEIFSKTVRDINPDLAVYGLAHSELEKACLKYNIPFYPEAFADRRYENDGNLRSRSFPDAVIHKPDEILNQLHHLIFENKVISTDQKPVVIEARTICLHSDTPNAVQLASTIYNYLKKNNVRISSDIR